MESLVRSISTEAGQAPLALPRGTKAVVGWVTAADRPASVLLKRSAVS